VTTEAEVTRALQQQQQQQQQVEVKTRKTE
jgi:hypothetical protein